MGLNKDKNRDVILIVQTSILNLDVAMIKRFGFKIAYIKSNISMEEILTVDFPFEDNENTAESTAASILKVAEKFNIQRIFTLNEYYIGLVAKLSKNMMIPYWGLNEESANYCRNKKLAKKIFQENRIPTADYYLIKSFKEVIPLMTKLKYPLVVKPSNESGSKLVSICNNFQDVIDSVYRINKTNKNYVGENIDSEILIEEYLDGQEYSIETYTVEGVNNIIAITKKQTKNCVEVAHTVPALLDEKIELEIKNLVSNALTALKIDYGVTHTEVKVTSNGIKIIEVNGRVAGDNISELVKSVYGINLYFVALSIALDGTINNIQSIEAFSKQSTIYYLTSNAKGILTYKNLDSIQDKFKIDMYYKSGRRVNKTIDNFTRLGYFILYNNELCNEEELLNLTLDKLCLEITEGK